ncbi:beta-lactamase domain protein [Alloactinosynnema sp. L-07]|uniref:MBL fold metallo-hydrolase n=1 Tax=Alloactinosynnema sp. L-07 TaxID=1653480 RepID=UPI00065F0469|nr:MBL fold metallo-hydrolase [Alloactinosynnema sp. L-07]CRK56609.1 beta-lactamase domain protein [Alloactinosynnema sp. L-07]
MAALDVVPLVDEGLGNSAYLVDLGDGRALAVDVSRDLRAVRAMAERRGLRIAFAADTHLHADFLSGARQLSATDGAQVLASAAGQREFTHTGLRDGDEVDLGGLRLRVLATPGHTHEHLSFVLSDGDRAIGVFTGGSLLVGSAARTDLVSPEQTESLARAQFASLHRLAALPGETAVWPTHGAGSFCSAPPSQERTSTVARELASNPLLRVADADAFVAALLGSLGSFPSYFLRLAEVNRRGPAVLDQAPTLPAVDIAAVRAAGAELVDVRPAAAFADGHIPGALSIPLRPAFASWLGWLAPHDRPIVIVRDPGQDPAEVAWQAAKIGYDNLIGELGGGMAAWDAAGHPITRTRLAGGNDLSGVRVLDVRQTSEYVDGHVPGAVHIELGELPARVDELAAEPTVVMCGHGERAMGAASVLESAGHRDLAVLVGGPGDWTKATGRKLETGE